METYTLILDWAGIGMFAALILYGPNRSARPRSRTVRLTGRMRPWTR